MTDSLENLNPQILGILPWAFHESLFTYREEQRETGLCRQQSKCWESDNFQWEFVVRLRPQKQWKETQNSFRTPELIKGSFRVPVQGVVQQKMALLGCLFVQPSLGLVLQSLSPPFSHFLSLFLFLAPLYMCQTYQQDHMTLLGVFMF